MSILCELRYHDLDGKDQADDAVQTWMKHLRRDKSVVEGAAAHSHAVHATKAKTKWTNMLGSLRCKQNRSMMAWSANPESWCCDRLTLKMQSSFGGEERRVKMWRREDLKCNGSKLGRWGGRMDKQKVARFHFMSFTDGQTCEDKWSNVCLTTQRSPYTETGSATRQVIPNTKAPTILAYLHTACWDISIQTCWPCNHGMGMSEIFVSFPLIAHALSHSYAFFSFVYATHLAGSLPRGLR